MMTARRTQDLIERLPPVRGRLTAEAPLAQFTWFRVGGAAEVMFRPADAEDLAEFLAKRPPEVPVTVIGVASNLLVRLRDERRRRNGVVVRTRPRLRRESRPAARGVSAGAGVARPQRRDHLPAPLMPWAGSNSCRAFPARSAVPCA